MGTVYLASDRLLRSKVALKRVTVPTDQLIFASRRAEVGADVALAQEFRSLATIRHPNIVSQRLRLWVRRTATALLHHGIYSWRQNGP